MAEEATVVVKEIKKETMTGKSGNEFVAVRVIGTNGMEFSGYDSDEISALQSGASATIRYQPITKKDKTQVNKILSVLKETLSQKESNTGTTTKGKTTMGHTTTSGGGTGHGKSIRIETQAILKSLLETGQYHMTVTNDRGTFLNLNEIALETHAKSLLAMIDRLADNG